MEEEKNYVWRVVKKASTENNPEIDEEMEGSIDDMKGTIARHMWYQSAMDEELYICGTVRPDDMSVTYVNDLPVVSGYADFAGFSLTMKAEAIRQIEKS